MWFCLAPNGFFINEFGNAIYVETRDGTGSLLPVDAALADKPPVAPAIMITGFVRQKSLGANRSSVQ